MRHSIPFCVLFAFLSAWPLPHGSGADPAQPQRPAIDQVAEGKLLVHEWGTFTTFSGSDGVFLDFRPLASEHSDLPYYVLDRGTFAQSKPGSKLRLWGRVRMETPVTYFYTDRVRTIDVRVDFPQGLLTEFYPPVREMLPPIDNKNIFGEGEKIGNSSLDWGKVDLIPIDQLVADTGGSQLADRLTDRIVHDLLPHSGNEQHYAAARETDAALVHVRGKRNLRAYEQSFFEKFLFYRGVGKFQLPISARFDNGQVSVSNDGDLPFNAAILIHIDGDQMLAAKIDRVAAGQSLPFDNLQEVSEQQLAQMVHQSLVDEGLFEKEAASMVKTWQSSWFTEKGTRVLYMVPAPTTDELLPLHVTPRPQETLRVLVGRMEIMSPEDEQRLTGAVARSIKTRATHETKPVPKGEKRKPYAIPAEIREYGRMAEPALARIRKLSKDPALRNEATLLITQFQRS